MPHTYKKSITLQGGEWLFFFAHSQTTGMFFAYTYMGYVLYNTTNIENWGSGAKRIMEACQKRGIAVPTWPINGGFVVVTFMRPAKGNAQSDTQGNTL